MDFQKTSSASTIINGLDESMGEKREIGDEAVWTLSSAKPGNGVEQLRDGNNQTFWQSDGIQPHYVNILFHKKMRIKEIAIYTDYKLDESYTPAKIQIKAGTGYHDLEEVRTVNLDEPHEWVSIPLRARKGGWSDNGGLLRAHLVQLAVLSSHQNGRDTHIRQIKIFGPRHKATAGLGTELSEFSTTEFQQFSCVR